MFVKPAQKILVRISGKSKQKCLLKQEEPIYLGLEPAGIDWKEIIPLLNFSLETR